MHKLLIANRGEIAVRIIRACREAGIRAVAVYSEADRDALHVRLADEAYPVGPAPAKQSYLRVEALLEAARSSGADAVHPGYGFLSERAHFARACQAAGLIWIGPPPDVIERMGSKIEAKRIAVAEGVPVVPGYDGADQSAQTLAAEAERLGYPLLIKASAGGGGKGMRAVERSEEFAAALEGARREAKAAFGDDAVLLEKLIQQPRHVEIQILADMYGSVVYLGERECSIQRRHQKIVEESPSPALDEQLRERMGYAAVRIARAVGYRNAGTVEFMLDGDGSYYFLEMNTRLQVEHPVTELVTGLDLVLLQLRIAAGQPLPFGQNEIQLRGHAIEARVYAEHPVALLPSTGRLLLFAPPDGPGVRNDAGVATGDDVTVHYDPMLAKLIVHAPGRAEAVARLRRALDEYHVAGVTTNLALLRAIAAQPAFAAGQTTTAFLERYRLAETLSMPKPVPDAVLAAAALLRLRDEPSSVAADPWLRPWRAGGAQHIRMLIDGTPRSVSIAAHGTSYRIELDGRHLEARIVARRQQLLTVELDTAGPTALPDRPQQHRLAAVRDGSALLISYTGQAYRIAPQTPLSLDELGSSRHLAAGHASLRAPMPGTIVKVHVEQGDRVAAGAPLVVLEAMKMEHTIVAPYDGVVTMVPFTPGQLVGGEAALVEIDRLPAEESGGRSGET